MDRWHEERTLTARCRRQIRASGYQLPMETISDIGQIDDSILSSATGREGSRRPSIAVFARQATRSANNRRLDSLVPANRRN